MLNSPPCARQLLEMRNFETFPGGGLRGVDFAEDESSGGEFGQWSGGTLRLRSSVIHTGLEKVRGSLDVAVGKCKEGFPIIVSPQVLHADLVSQPSRLARI